MTETSKPSQSVVSELVGDLKETVKPVVVAQAEKLSAAAAVGVTETIESLPDTVARATVAMLYPTFTLPVRVLVWVLCLSSIVVSWGLGWLYYLNPANYEFLDAVVIALIPLAGLVALVAVPIKSLAYGSLQLGIELTRRKLAHSEQTNTVSQSTNAANSAIEISEKTSDSTAREQRNSEH